LSGVQDTVEDVQINGTGYGVILNNDGMIIANPDKELNGKYYTDYPETADLFDTALKTGEGNFTAVVGGKNCTVFVDQVLDQWTLVIITEDTQLFEAPRSILVVSVIVNLSAFILLAGFYILSYQYEIKANKRLDEMKALEQQKDYEAKLLKLEKTAADTANKAKSDFLADMSHEIRTPINAVLGMNEMILNKCEDEEILDYASSIKSAGKTLLSIINNILDFSKIEDGKMNLVPVEFDTTVLITGLVNSISERAKAKQLDLIVDVDETVPSKLYGDDVRISQVIMKCFFLVAGTNHKVADIKDHRGQVSSDDLTESDLKEGWFSVFRADYPKLHNSLAKSSSHKIGHQHKICDGNQI
jgi:signal transduction histidine kinase